MNDSGKPRFLHGAVVLALRSVIGLILIATLPLVSVDDYFRVFHAAWWWDHISFTTSHDWLPGYAYIYGTLIGLSHDTLIVPRLVSMGLALMLGAAFAFGPAGRQGAGWMAAAWVLFSPLALVLGSVPLSEAAYMTTLAGGALALSSYLESGKGVRLLGASALYLMAAMIRYEAWAFLPLFGYLALRRRPVDTSRLLHVMLSILPWIYPAVWTAALWAIQGEPLLYLLAVEQDHFGAGDLGAAMVSMPGLVSGVQVMVVVVAVALGFLRSNGRARAAADLVWPLHVAVALAVVVLVVILGMVPSQYSLRLLYPVLILGAVPVCRAIGEITSGRPRMAAFAFLGVLLVAGGVSLIEVEPGVDESVIEAGDLLRSSFDEGRIGQDCHVVVEHDLPEATAMVVLSGRPDRVHVDNMGGICPAKMLIGMLTMCEFPDWAPQTRAAMVRPDGKAWRYLRFIRWEAVWSNRSWMLMIRPDGAPFPGEGLFDIPDFVTPPPGLGTLAP